MNYLQEWQQSCVDQQLIELNVTALEGVAPSEYLFYSDHLPRRNDGRVRDDILKRYEHTEAGGWWCSGIDVMTGEKDLWGCFKPNQPRLSFDRQKLIKYEHPPKTATGIFALQVPAALWQKIAQRHNHDKANAVLNTNTESGDFWQWVLNNPDIPICITEGAKKAGSLLTMGYAAIALPGINNGYRTPKDEWGNRTGKSHLIPQLAKFATKQRKIYIIFDQDSCPHTIKAVNTAIRKLGYLFTQAGCQIYIITWPPEWGKGVDDVIASQGTTVFDPIFQQALPLEMWKAQGLNQLTFSPQTVVNSAYLPLVDLPENAKLVGIKSPKGTGKTEYLATLVKQAIALQKKVLVIGHRIKLVEALCQRFGLPYVSEIKDKNSGASFGYGLCIDSLHPHSQVQFDVADWHNAIIIIDEVEQVLWHGLNSDTCKKNRVAILTTFKKLLQTVLSGKGKVYLADADLSDISLEYMIALAGFSLTPFIIKNDWKPNHNETWPVYHYQDNSPKRFIKDLVKDIRNGGKPFVCLSAQKLSSQWGTQNLESYLVKQFPQQKILRLDSESLSDPAHPAYHCMQHLDQVLRNYDIVLASPAIETGISIDLKCHFTSVWGLAQGVQTATSVSQALHRIRDNIPRYLWVANYGFNTIGNGSTSIPNLLTSGHRLTQLNIRLLQQSDLTTLDDWDTGFQAESLLCWAKMAVRVNTAMINYRETILGLLRQENHEIIEHHPPKKTKSEDQNSRSITQLTDAINEVRQQNYQAECKAIAYALDLTEEQFKVLKKRLIKSQSQRHSIRKFELKQRYGITITPQIVVLDDQGWYQQLRLHYFLTMGRSFLSDRDTVIARNLIRQGHGSLFLPDFNGSQLGVIIGTMEVLGISVLLNYPERVLSPLDPDLQAMANLAIQNRHEIKTVLKIGLALKSSPITIIRRFLNLMGLKIACIGTKKIAKKRIRIYQILPPEDQRQAVFIQWFLRDQKCPGSSELWVEEYWQNFNLMSQNNDNEDQYIQLKLNL